MGVAREGELSRPVTSRTDKDGLTKQKLVVPEGRETKEKGRPPQEELPKVPVTQSQGI